MSDPQDVERRLREIEAEIARVKAGWLVLRWVGTVAWSPDPVAAAAMGTAE